MRNKEGSTGGWSTRRLGGDHLDRRFRFAVSFGRSLPGSLFLLRRFFLSGYFQVVLVHNPVNIGAGLAKWRHSPVLFDAPRAGVVCGQRLDKIEIVALQKFSKIAAPALDIGLGIEGIGEAKL